MSTNPPIAGAVLAAIVLSAANAVAQSIDFGVFDLRFQALNSNTHASIFGIVSLIACALTVVASVIFAKKTQRLSGAVLSCMLAVLLVLRIWNPPNVLMLALPFTAITLVMLWRVATGGTRGIVRGGCLLLVASFVIHAAETKTFGLIVLNPDSWAYQIRCVVKHDAELSGWILIAVGLLYLALERRPPSEIEHGAWKRERSQPTNRPVTTK
jgi:hypothetical protein